jgi:hypothetical protein
MRRRLFQGKGWAETRENPSGKEDGYAARWDCEEPCRLLADVQLRDCSFDSSAGCEELEDQELSQGFGPC